MKPGAFKLCVICIRLVQPHLVFVPADADDGDGAGAVLSAREVVAGRESNILVVHHDVAAQADPFESKF